MIVANDVTVDTRVKKSAATLSKAGLEVIVLGISRSGARGETKMGDVRVIKLVIGPATAVGYTLKGRFKMGLIELLRGWYAHWNSAGVALEARARARRPTRMELATYAVFRVLSRFVEAGASTVVTRFRKPTATASPAALDEARLAPRGSWRRLLPELHDYERAFLPVLDKLRPAVLHVHDVHLIGVAAKAADSARAQGHHVKTIYDSHEYVAGLARYPKELLEAWVQLERENIGKVDRVITVSPMLASRLKSEHALKKDPVVVLNAPPMDTSAQSKLGVRRAAGVDEASLLVVYAGGVAPARGIDTLIDAVGLLPDEIYLVIVTKEIGSYLRQLLSKAQRNGFADRVRLARFVRPDQVSQYLSSADLGVSPFPCDYVNHQVALPNKLFEYMHAGMPVVVSDCPAMAEFVERNGIGKSFRSGDPRSLADSIVEVLSQSERYRGTIRRDPSLLKTYSWDRQAEKLLDVYGDLLDWQPKPPAETPDLPDLSELNAIPDGLALGIGPRNLAGQAWAWTRAILSRASDVKVESFEVAHPGRLDFPADRRIDTSTWRSPTWRGQQIEHIVKAFTHVLSESASSVLGGTGMIGDDLPILQSHGIEVGIVLHGSEVRDPIVHKRLMPHSPFGSDDLLTRKLQKTITRVREQLDGFDGPVFVTTPDLLNFVPQGKWLPVVIDAARWSPDTPLRQAGRLVVVHAPTSDRLKGSEHVDQICHKLYNEGRIVYRRVSGLAQTELSEAIKAADVFIDGLVLGAYGVTACQALASGRVVIGNVDLLPAPLKEECPIINADPTTLEEVLRGLSSDPDRLREIGDRGPAFVSRYHDGTVSTGVLMDFLGIRGQSKDRQVSGG